ncbi:hypothetical protein GCM10011505_40030 [Tistrella bauzanensis]|uniref:TIGR02186 family protein n=1 Tax=Tistrella bauzanensis TaxID=657419 RepID=A0ABQ1IXF7_9PROT|nr:TIGR02186 family protein [Tistrella bauzanensis]GGB55011.1 hypothetical protein GCM10011505_40030 [Tistrella bauzanensis]
MMPASDRFARLPAILAFVLALAAALAVALIGPLRARAQPLVADLSSHLISITSSFTGTELLLFGATDGPGEVIVVIRGPAETVDIRRKDRILGMWINAQSVRFSQVPAFYWVGASAPLDQFTNDQMLSRHRIGLNRLDFPGGGDVTPEDRITFRDALIRNRQQAGVFVPSIQPISRLGDRLFRVTVSFPSNVPTGAYRAEIFLVHDGRVVSAQTTPLFVRKDGLGDNIARLAHEQPFGYGVAAVLIALGAGWAAGFAFRRF